MRAQQTASKSLPRRPTGSGGRAAGDTLPDLMARCPEVQLATLVDAVPDGADWVHEIKFDGYRLLGFLSRGTARLVTLDGKDSTAKFPSLISALEDLRASDAVFDMEAGVVN